MEDGQEAPRECPVCFETVLGAESTLACRHVLCQTCPGKMLVLSQDQGYIICPLCRRLTIVKKQKEAGEILATDQQQAPVPLSLGYLQTAPRTSVFGLWHRNNWVGQYLRENSQQVSEQTITNSSDSQIFTRNSHGRPTMDGDTAVNIAEVEPQEHIQCRFTTTDFICLLVVIFLFTLVWLLGNHL